MNDLSAYASLKDYEREAQKRLDASTWAYLHRAAADEISFHRNESAFERIMLCPKPMQPMQGGSAGLTLLGAHHAYPVLIAPIAHQRLAHTDGELATAAAAAAMNTGMVVSTLASHSLERIADVPGSSTAGRGPLWFQLYFQPVRAQTLALLQRAERAGYQAIVLTIDAPITGPRNAEQRARFTLPPGVISANLKAFPAPRRTEIPAGQSLFDHPLMSTLPTWQDLRWLISQTPLPVLVKGILHPDSARQAIEAGAAGLIVSNHGGRVLDTVPAALEALPAVAGIVNGRMPILLDGGIRRGTDVLKALALGANAVLVGRPILHGLAVGGAAGVAHVLHILRTEFEAAMLLCGCRNVSSIDQTILWDACTPQYGRGRPCA